MRASRPPRPQPWRLEWERTLAPNPSSSHISRPRAYILALLALLLEPLPPLLEASACLSSRSVTQIQNQLMTSTKAKAKKTLFLSPSPPHVLAAYPGGGWTMRLRTEEESPKMGLEGEKTKE